MKVTRKRVCDVCGSDDGVCRYRITKLEGFRITKLERAADQRTVTADLCTEHGVALEDAMLAAPVTRRGRKSTKPVVSLDQITAKKAPAGRTAKKTPAKKPGSSRSR